MIGAAETHQIQSTAELFESS